MVSKTIAGTNEDRHLLLHFSTLICSAIDSYAVLRFQTPLPVFDHNLLVVKRFAYLTRVVLHNTSLLRFFFLTCHYYIFLSIPFPFSSTNRCIMELFITLDLFFIYTRNVSSAGSRGYYCL